MLVNDVSRRPVRLKVDRLPPEAVGRLKWVERVWSEVGKETSGGRPSGLRGWTRAVWCLRNGFLPMSYDLYSLGTNDPREYLSDREREMSWVLNWPYAGILDDKLGFDSVLRQAGAPTPELRALVLGGRLAPLDPRSVGADRGWWREQLDRLGRLVLKPIWGGGGTGIRVLERSDGGCLMNGEPLSYDELEARVARLDRYVVSTFAQQAAYAQAVFPGSANTIRVLTMHDEQRVPFIAGAAHRFGSTRSRAPVDNTSAGGLSAGVDLEGGTLTTAVRLLHHQPAERHDRHPDTGAQITGTRVANWDRICGGILAVARRLPFLPYIGWDVVATDDGFLVIEGNKQNDVQLLQVHRPLLRDPRVRAFYERERILRPA